MGEEGERYRAVEDGCCGGQSSPRAVEPRGWMDCFSTATMVVQTVCVTPRCTVLFSPHYLINGTIFEKQLLNIKCVF